MFAVFGFATVTQTLSGSLPLGVKLILGLSAQAVGLVFVALSMHMANMPVFLVAGIITGIGAGILFKSAIGTVAAQAAPAERGKALAGLFLVSYLGLSLPVPGLGIATRFTSSITAMTWLTCLLLVVLPVVALLSRPRTARP